MPNPIDKCASCGRPVYVEAAVTGGCGCPERDLRLLLAQQKALNNQTGIGAGPRGQELPDLPPDLFMPKGVQAEFQAPLRGQPRLAIILDDASTWDSNQIEGFDGSGLDGELEGSFDARNAHHRPSPRQVTASEVDLAAMWMQSTGIPYEPGQLVPDAPTDTFEFSTADDIRLSDYGPRGGEGAPRFRVDSPPPPRPVFNRTMVNNQGPMRETSRVRGRFAVMAEVAPRNEDLRAIQASVGDPSFDVLRPSPPPRGITAEQANARQSAVQQARVVQAKTKIPSVYDRLRKNPYE